MLRLLLCTFVLVARETLAQIIVVEDDMNFRIEAGGRTCFFEKGRAGQTMEAQYQVIDGQQGDLDISFSIKSPTGALILDDYKMPQNSIIVDLEEDGEYVFCMDNTFSMINSKLVFVYVMMEAKTGEEEAPVAVVEGGEEVEPEVLEWMGTDENEETYYIEVAAIADSVANTLRHVLKARHLLSVYAASRSRDAYSALNDTFIVDAWSAFQISLMCVVGLVQVYMIKKLFDRPSSRHNYYF